MIAVQSGTSSWRAIQSAADLLAGEVEFDGVFVYALDGRTPLMVWDSGLGNVRAMTAQEVAALPAQQQAARDATNPDLATLRDAAQNAVANNNAAVSANQTYIATASPTNAQVAAQVRALTQQMNGVAQELTQIIKAVAALTKLVLLG